LSSCSCCWRLGRQPRAALLQEVTRPERMTDAPVWRSALDVDYLAKPFTLVRRLFATEPDPKLVRRLMPLDIAGRRTQIFFWDRAWPFPQSSACS